MDVVTIGAFSEGYLPFDQGKQGVILAYADAVAGVDPRAPLANDDVAWNGFLSTKQLDAQSPADGVSSVAGTARRFFMCHDLPFSLNRNHLGICRYF